MKILRDRIQEADLEAYSGRRIVLTGGGAQLNGVREVAEYVFNKRVRIGRPHGVLGLKDTLSGPDFAVAVGLLKQDFMSPERSDFRAARPVRSALPYETLFGRRIGPFIKVVKRKLLVLSAIIGLIIS